MSITINRVIMTVILILLFPLIIITISIIYHFIFITIVFIIISFLRVSDKSTLLFIFICLFLVFVTTLSKYTLHRCKFNIIQIVTLLNYLKQLNQFAISMDAYQYAKNQHHSSIQFWHIEDLILEITFIMPKCTRQHPYECTESYRRVHVCIEIQ